MGTKSEEYLYKYRLTNTITGEVFEARGWTKVNALSGLKPTNRFVLQKTKKWKVEILEEPVVWDESTYRQSLYAQSKGRYVAYEKRKKQRDRLFESRKRLRLRGHRNIDGSVFTAEQHEEMICQPCEACGSVTKTVVDHEHASGFVRGTLCDKCNLALGMVKDNKNTLIGLIRYLDSFEERKKSVRQE